MQPKLLILVVLLLAVVLSTNTPSARIVHEFCWKDTYVRGVGTVPDHCAQGQQRIGLLCYPNCPSGMYRWGFDCHSYCPEGWLDQGLFCRLAEYGRGAGYPWKFGDPLNDSGMIRRCEADHGQGNCEKNGAMYYPKCAAGYHNYGCCICRPEVPYCPDYNLNPGIDLSCAKKVIIGTPLIGQCYESEEIDAGLCYPKCDPAYDGVGPVCWGMNPSGWVGCGMGSAINSMVCTDTIFDQIMSVGQMALDVVTLGAASIGTGLPEDLKKLQDAFDTLGQLYDSTSEIADIVAAAVNDPVYGPIASDAEQIRGADSQALLPQDIVRISSSIAALVDPTGIAGTVAAFSYPICSSIFGAYSASTVSEFDQRNIQEAERRFEVELKQKDVKEQQKIMEEIAKERKRRFEWVKSKSSKKAHPKVNHPKAPSKAEL